NWRNETVFVTGATGFIGGRVSERMMQADVKVRALVHGMHRAARIARLPVELCPGDLLERESLRQALGGAKLVIHCGVGPASSIVRGTENMLSVAHAAGVKRFIHVSTAAIYGITPPPGSESEDAPLRRTGDAYCDNKAAAEKVVLNYGKRGQPGQEFRAAAGLDEGSGTSGAQQGIPPDADADSINGSSDEESVELGQCSAPGEAGTAAGALRRAARGSEFRQCKIHSGRSNGSDAERDGVLQHRESAKGAGLRAAGSVFRGNETGRTVAALCGISLGVGTGRRVGTGREELGARNGNGPEQMRKYEKKQILKNVGSSWSALAVNVLVGIFLSPFILHRLGDAAFGVWVLIFSVTGYYGLFYLGIRSSIIRYVSKYTATGENGKL